MSIKSKVLAAAATLTLVGGVGMAGALTAGTASAATPSCGLSCINLFSHQFGSFRSPNYTVDVLRQGEKVGQPIILFRTANYDPALDWTVAFQGLMADFFAADLVSAAVALHYGCTAAVFTDCTLARNDPAFEIEYAPFGVDSGLCMGVAAHRVQRRGRDAAAVWRVVQDRLDRGHLRLAELPAFGGFVPLINGSDTNFSQPFVLTYPAAVTRPTCRVRSSS